ncbi:hypothetical protein QBC46DRAFT_97414 [Diplogelasinospora grovesii]|uniref:Uncharacterized protein n=1 Tax=Diplogelasinospora grovesii TaxID=303347 RepID=A0AAN6S6F3_9PEZI|nr:hypothetical protein QBC46DRAFT_97414 [Diplogelasinospora grovesii]
MPVPVANVDVSDVQNSQAGQHQPLPQANTQENKPTGAGVNTGAGTTRPKTEAELQADRDYEERMEDEYAKREGGA